MMVSEIDQAFPNWTSVQAYAYDALLSMPHLLTAHCLSMLHGKIPVRFRDVPDEACRK
jgi:hypothetical protein